ncbi:MAG TPA: TrbI/VirB10 family protein [Rhizomicrobium sp.]
MKVDPETLVLRGSPRPVTRFKRHVVIGVAAIVVIAICAAGWVALSAPPLHAAIKGAELYNTDRKPTADGLATLPATYDKVKPPALGPALPGDLGPSIVSREQNLGMSPTDAVKPTAEVEAARAEQMRFAQQAQQAREATVFYHTTNENAGSTAPNPIANPINPVPVLADNAAAGNSGKLPGLDPAHDQNNQLRKLNFVGQEDDKDVYNPHILQTPTSRYEILAGSLIPASLVTGLDSDLPGLVVGQVTQDVFDSVSGKFLLIPHGSRIIGTYDSVVAFGQSRALVVWQRIIMPDGSSIEIDNLPGTDTEGYAGLSDSVDYHTWTLLKGVAISTLLGVGTQLSLGNGQSDLITALRQSAQDSVNQAGQQITQKNLDIQPTLKIRPGWPLRILVHKDLILRPYTG